MKKVNTYYVAVLEDGYKYRIKFSDISRINPNTVLGCVVYEEDESCALYYNEGNFPKDELKGAGYKIVEEILQVDTYVEETTVYKTLK